MDVLWARWSGNREEPRDVNKIDIVFMDHVLSEVRRDIGRMVTRLAMSTEKLKARRQRLRRGPKEPAGEGPHGPSLFFLSSGVPFLVVTFCIS